MVKAFDANERRHIRSRCLVLRSARGRVRCEDSPSQPDHRRRGHMSTITTNDGTTIYYKDWGKGPVITFSHGWPLNSDMWDGQMLFFAERGFRVVAHDRRGHGRSSQAWAGNDMD